MSVFQSASRFGNERHARRHAPQNARSEARAAPAPSSSPPTSCACGGSCPRCGAKKEAGERKNGVVHGPAGTANRFDDCPANWKPVANAAQTLGASWLGNVVTGLGALPSPLPARVSALLTTHFHTTYDKDIAKILERFKKLNTAIKQSIDFQCESSCDKNVLAYVYSVWSDLHVCPYWFGSAPDLQASTVIHELAHDVVGCDDNAYEWESAKYAKMSVSDAMNNADSYAHFAWDASKP
ncbi:M35 family metallo-endopeptidase [Variovorax sp. RCC_210]|uniref:M35 family metallo-endopeptidase n=1 Tax=Variovorax sp. RCC_210 TaxID=3239217 RepID=UPI003526AA24